MEFFLDNEEIIREFKRLKKENEKLILENKDLEKQIKKKNIEIERHALGGFTIGDEVWYVCKIDHGFKVCEHCNGGYSSTKYISVKNTIKKMYITIFEDLKVKRIDDEIPDYIVQDFYNFENIEYVFDRHGLNPERIKRRFVFKDKESCDYACEELNNKKKGIGNGN